MHAKLIRLRAQIVKELLCLLRDPKSRTIMIGPPLIQLFVFSFAMTLEIQNVDLALLNRDAGNASLEFVQQLQASRLVKRSACGRAVAASLPWCATRSTPT